MLNEPDWRINRKHLKDFYQKAIINIREWIKLPYDVPIVVMEWDIMWFEWEGQWDKVFHEDMYGKVYLDAHIYQFKDTVQKAERAWDIFQWPLFKHIAKQVPTMLGEYTLSLSKDIPTEDLQQWA